MVCKQIFAQPSNGALANLPCSYDAIIIIPVPMLTVLSSWHSHCKSSPGSYDKCSTQRQVAADLWTKPISLSQQIHL